MNTPNPLVPQGTFADKGKAQIRNTVFIILAGHLVLLVGLLFAGCNKKDAEMAGNDTTLPQTPTPLNDPWPPSPPATPTQSIAQTTPQTLPVAPLTPVTPPGPQPPPPDPVAPTGFTEHTILKGDTFASLGQKYKIGYKAIADANPGVDPTKLKLGQKVRIPPPRTMVVNARTPAGLGTGAPDNGGEKIHIVKSGDRLFTIAKTYGVTVKEIQTANNMPTTGIRVGQKLKIPSRAAPPLEATTPPPVAPTAATP